MLAVAMFVSFASHLKLNNHGNLVDCECQIIVAQFEKLIPPFFFLCSNKHNITIKLLQQNLQQQ